MNSTHRCEIVVVHSYTHPNADRLEVVQLDNYTIVTGKGNFLDGDLGVYFPPDTIVPTSEPFRFLWESKGYVPPLGEDTLGIPEKYRRVKAKRIRGVISEGLLLPVRELQDVFNLKMLNVGDDASEIIGTSHYNPPEIGGACENAPTKRTKKRGYPRSLRGWVSFLLSLLPGRRKTNVAEETDAQIPDYDMDAWQKYGGLLEPNELVWITEKIHGANARYVFMNGRMYAGSHHQWKKFATHNEFWMGLAQNPWIENFCNTYPEHVVYGELVPTQVKKQNFAYGQSPRKFRVFVFDIYNLKEHRYLTYLELQNLTWSETHLEGDVFQDRGILDEVYWVPTVSMNPYRPEVMRTLASGPSLVPHAGHIREGIVIKTMDERADPRLGRVILKLKSPEFLEKE